MSTEIQTAVNWTELVVGIAPKQLATFPEKHKNTIRFIISNMMVKDFPEREYKTWIDKKKETINVFRAA